MKSRKAIRVIAGILLCGAGIWLAVPSPYRERTYFIDAGGCRMETAVVERPAGAARGSVVLFHGISANKKIMSYLARGFAEQGLRVYTPDFPGHGRTPGSFSPARAEQCGEALVRELLARGAITPDRTILAGHSMGGAMALRIASRVPLAGVIAISPAPMRAAHGVSPEMLLFTDPPPLPQNSLVVSGALEPESMRGNAFDLVTSGKDNNAKYVEIPHASHVSVLFSGAVVRASQDWTARTFHLETPAALPSHRPLVGAIAGFVGLLLLAGPFLREAVGKSAREEIGASGDGISVRRLLLEFFTASVAVVAILRIGIPLKAIRVFQGDYFASFVLLLGVALMAAHWGAMRTALASVTRQAWITALTGILLFLLVSAWFDLTFYEAWLTTAKWARFPFLVLAVLPYHLAEETLIGPAQPGKKSRRLAVALSLRVISWGAIMGGVLLLYSGEILMGLLAAYLALFAILQKSGMEIVREETGSAAATALFGAILLAGFCLVIFPIT